MRVMEEFITDRDLGDEMQEFMTEETGNTGFYLGHHSDMDESSGAEDPEKSQREEVRKLKAEAADRRAFVEAVQGGVECRSVTLDMERARMELADIKSEKNR